MFFGITKLLAFLPFGNVLKGTLGKVLIGAGLLIAAIIFWNIWITNHDAKITQQALDSFNAAQAEQTAKDRAEFQRRLHQLSESQASRVLELEAERDVLRETTETLIDQIRSGNIAGSDNRSSDVLRETVRALEAQRRERNR